ncbi:hypothetical protein [Gluconobacter oxydans]|uniref:hypothetical protein n=1 Tax=Gluconobacter oxydans TaxID=442 RepID=UPI0035E7B027
MGFKNVWATFVAEIRSLYVQKDSTLGKKYAKKMLTPVCQWMVNRGATRSTV